MRQTIRQWVRGRQVYLAVTVVALGAVIATGIVLSAPARNGTSSIPSTDLAACKVASVDFRCYAERLAWATYQQSPTAAFAELRAAYANDSYVQGQCHQMAHIIGRTALKKYGSLGAAFPKGDSFCWSGYHHGITEQAIADVGGAKIKAQANEICAALKSDQPYSFDHYNCVHGLGHGFMAVDSYELFTALQTCDLLTDQWEKTSCYGGVYMENVMVATRGDGTSKYLKKDDLLYPCNAVAASYKEQCYLMQSSYMLQNNNYNFADTFRLCAAADAAFVNTCYTSIGRDASGSTVSDVARTKQNCAYAQDVAAAYYCMVGAVKDFVAYYHSDQQALQLCGAFGGDLLAPCQQIVKEYYATF